MSAPESAAPAQSADPAGCEGAEPFALMVLGDSMLPEFAEGEVVVIEPSGLPRDGSFVLALWNGEWMLRQLRATAAGGWSLATLHDGSALPIPDLAPVRGVVLRKVRPGRRREARNYPVS